MHSELGHFAHSLIPGQNDGTVTLIWAIINSFLLGQVWLHIVKISHEELPILWRAHFYSSHWRQFDFAIITHISHRPRQSILRTSLHGLFKIKNLKSKIKICSIIRKLWIHTQRTLLFLVNWSSCKEIF